MIIDKDKYWIVYAVIGRSVTDFFADYSGRLHVRWLSYDRETNLHDWVAYKVDATLLGRKEASRLMAIHNVAMEQLSDKELLRIYQHRMKRKAKELFKLAATSPKWLLADRFEEEGMLEEAELLRRKA